MVERTLTAEHAEYDQKTERLLLFAPVNGQDTDGQEMHSESDMLVGTKEGAETLATQGKTTLKIFVDEDEDAGATEEKQTPPAPKLAP